MKNDILSVLSEQSKGLVAPVQKLNKLAVANAEKLTALQLANLRSYADLGLAQLKAAADVQDPKGLQDYVAKQGEFLKVVGEKLVADAKVLGELGVEFNTEVQKLVQESVEAAAAKAA